MSAFGGFCNWDGQPVPAKRLSELDVYLRAAGPDSHGTLQPTPWMALQSHLLHFDRLSTLEQQPYAFGQGSVLTWNGRLDNRDDMRLLLSPRLQGPHTDAAIVAAAYEQWGLDAIPRLIGDWALAIWDAPEERIVLARDFMGNRPLYYLASKNQIAWATGLEALAAAHHRFDAPDDLAVAGYILGATPEGRTLYSDILRLVAGHLLVATREGTTLRRYWHYTPSTLRYRQLDQYADHLRVLITEGVRVRLRATRPVWAHLSGGWDSSSVVCIAHRLILHRDVEAPALRCISIVYPDREAEPELEYIHAVEQWCGLSTMRVTKRGPTTFSERLGQRVIAPRDDVHRLDRIIQASGEHVVMTGAVGDIIGTPINPWTSIGESIRDQRLTLLAQGIIEWARGDSIAVPALLNRLLHNDYSGQRRWLRLRRHSSSADLSENLVSPRLATELQLSMPTLRPSLREFSSTARPLVELAYRMGDWAGLVVDELCQPVSKTHPYTHRPLIEFLLAIPRSAMFEPGFSRAGMGRALNDVLPPLVRHRRTSVGVSPLPDKRLKMRLLEGMRDAPPLVEPPSQWQLVRRGIIEPNWLTAAVEALRRRPRPSPILARSVAAEAWLRSLAAESRDVSSAHVAQTMSSKGP